MTWNSGAARKTSGLKIGKRDERLTVDEDQVVQGEVFRGNDPQEPRTLQRKSRATRLQCGGYIPSVPALVSIALDGSSTGTRPHFEVVSILDCIMHQTLGWAGT